MTDWTVDVPGGKVFTRSWKGASVDFAPIILGSARSCRAIARASRRGRFEDTDFVEKCESGRRPGAAS
jgi:hypothetical protein